MQLSHHISDFTRRYLQTRLTLAGDPADLSAGSLRLLVDLYEPYLTYDSIRDLLLNFANYAARVITAEDQAAADTLLRSLFIPRVEENNHWYESRNGRENFHMINDAYLTALSAKYSGGDKSYQERYEDEQVDRALIDVLVMQDSTFMLKKGWEDSVMYALDNLYLVLHPTAMQPLNCDLNPEQQAWFEKLTAWFLQVMVLGAQTPQSDQYLQI